MNTFNYSYDNSFVVSVDETDSLFTARASTSESFNKEPLDSPEEDFSSLSHEKDTKIRRRQSTQIYNETESYQRSKTVSGNGKNNESGMNQMREKAKSYSLIVSSEDFEELWSHHDVHKKLDPYSDFKVISALNDDIENYASSHKQRFPRNSSMILDAPDFEDDYYKQLLHWSREANKIAIGLDNALYIWDHENHNSVFLTEFDSDEELCSLRWNPQGTELALGMSSGEIKVWDVMSNSLASCMMAHDARVGCLEWTHEGLFSGSKDTCIQLVDVRKSNPLAMQFRSHHRQILNLQASPFGLPYLLSSSNDSCINVTDFRSPEFLVFSEKHQSPARAIGWSPLVRGQFASGGGSADQMLKVWDLFSCEKIDEVFAGAQICDLKFGGNAEEIYLGLGGGLNVVDVFEVGNLNKIGSLKGHEKRVLNLEMSPDGKEVVSISPDETMRFWDLGK
jgi:WD40 repeat protein